MGTMSTGDGWAPRPKVSGAGKPGKGKKPVTSPQPKPKKIPVGKKPSK